MKETYYTRLARCAFIHQHPILHTSDWSASMCCLVGFIILLNKQINKKDKHYCNFMQMIMIICIVLLNWACAMLYTRGYTVYSNSRGFSWCWEMSHSSHTVKITVNLGLFPSSIRKQLPTLEAKSCDLRWKYICIHLNSIARWHPLNWLSGTRIINSLVDQYHVMWWLT